MITESVSTSHLELSTEDVPELFYLLSALHKLGEPVDPTGIVRISLILVRAIDNESLQRKIEDNLEEARAHNNAYHDNAPTLFH